jgi:hypothetical protein
VFTRRITERPKSGGSAEMAWTRKRRLIIKRKRNWWKRLLTPTHLILTAKVYLSAKRRKLRTLRNHAILWTKSNQTMINN